MISLKNLTVAPSHRQQMLLHLQDCMIITYQPEKDMSLLNKRGKEDHRPGHKGWLHAIQIKSKAVCSNIASTMTLLKLFSNAAFSNNIKE